MKPPYLKDSEDRFSSDDLYLSIVIPVYNEEENVAVLYKEIRDSVDSGKIPYEIIFIDDGSSDRSFDILQDLKARELREQDCLAQTRVIKFSRNFGQTAAMQAGFDLAIGNAIVSSDGDLQNDPRDIPELVSKLEEGYDLVCGWRKNRKDKVLTRKIPSKIANWLIKKVIGVHIHDLGCSLKAYRSPMIKSMRLYSDMHRFIPVIASMRGARIAEVVVNHRARMFGEAKYGLSRTWKVLLDLITIKMLVNFQYRPIWWFGMFGLIFGALGVGLGIASITVWLQEIRSMVFSGGSFLLLFLSGSLISWGLLAEYLISHDKRSSN